MADVESSGGDTNRSPLEELENLTLEELDEEEYDIPRVGTPPTLESILNEQDDDLSDDGMGSPLPQVPPLLLGENDSGSMTSRGSKSSSRRSGRKPVSEKGETILRQVTLKGVSKQIVSAAERVSAGQPSAMAIRQLMAIGTSRGLVLVFDLTETLRWCLGSIEIGEEFGSVSSMDFNRESSKLIVGYARGQIILYDIVSGKMLQVVSDAHPPGNAVVHLKFTDVTSIALCSDSGGSVFELTFKRVMGSRMCDSRCLFSGSRGEVCVIEPLRMGFNFESHTLADLSIVAMASLSKVIIASIRPHLKVLFTYPLNMAPTTLPLLSWQFVVIQVTSDSRVIDPVLAFGRESTIYFYQVSTDAKEEVVVSPLQKLHTGFVMLGFHWMNNRTLAALDTLEQLHLMDVRTMEDLEVIDLSPISLVYSSAHFKGLATGGNVSKAFALAGERACYYSMTSFGNQLLLLGTKSVHVVMVRTWKERLDHMVHQKKIKEALTLGIAFYEEKAKAVVGLVGKRDKRKKQVANKMMDMLETCIERFVSDMEMEDCKSTVKTCIGCCILLGRSDLLFGRLYEAFSMQPLAHGAYMEELEPYILSDKITYIPPNILQQYVCHYEECGKMKALEASIVHLDITCMDIHQVVTLCWTHGLYDGILSVHNRAMKDYITPFEELATVLKNALDTGKQLNDSQIKLGNTLLVYISFCMAGRAYPVGDIPVADVASVKYEVFKCVTSLHSKNASESEQAYPYLRTLLRFDTPEFLNVLALAFQEKEFTTELGIRQRQRIIDILLKIMVDGEGWSATDVCTLFTFLARQMARSENVTVDGTVITLNRNLLDQILRYLTSVGPRHTERQHALMELIQATGGQHYDETVLIEACEKAEFYRICEYLYEKRQDYDKILSCYLRDPARKNVVFVYIKGLIQNGKEGETQRIKRQAIESILELVIIDHKKTAEMVAASWPESVEDILDNLKSNPQAEYKFLEGLMLSRQTLSSNQAEGMTFPAPVMERYIELMCQFSPQEVHTFLKANEGYRVGQTLSICQRYNLAEATAHLLELTGDIQGALKLMLDKLSSRIEAVLNSGNAVEVEFSQLQALALVIIQLCQRNSLASNQESCKSLWFPLLDTLMEPQRDFSPEKTSENVVEGFKEVTRHILNSMMAYIGLPVILQKVINDPAYSGGTFGEIKELVLSMMATYKYEVTLLSTTARLFQSDIHSCLSQLKTEANRAVSSYQSSCSLCRTPLGRGTVALFQCGHAYHKSCLDEREVSVCVRCGLEASSGPPSVETRVRKHPHPELQIASPSTGPTPSLQWEAKRDQHSHQPSNFQIFEELTDFEAVKVTSGSSVFSSEEFNLKLKPQKFTEVAEEF